MTPERIPHHSPVFIVGSPRSGTSILTWCLGQHPNLLGLEESNWMAPFAVDVAVAFRRGTARGERSQFSAMGMERERFMREIGECLDESILGYRHAYEERLVQRARPDSPENHPAFKISRDGSDPKGRWVNGTPEYSHGIAGLRKLYPQARFIHLVRDCDLVVTSMLNFDRVAGARLVETAEEGYGRWLSCVRSCLLAESAYGPEVVCRILHKDMVDDPEGSIRRLLEFIGEPFAAACLQPLAKRINSSRVESVIANQEAVPAVALEARDLLNQLETATTIYSQAEAAARMELQFEERVEYEYQLDAQYSRAQQFILKLQEEFNERTSWALQLQEELTKKNGQVRELQKELVDRTEWARREEKEIFQRDATIRQLQKEFAERTAWAIELEKENSRKDALILDLQARGSAPPSLTTTVEPSSPVRKKGQPASEIEKEP